MAKRSHLFVLCGNILGWFSCLYRLVSRYGRWLLRLSLVDDLDLLLHWLLTCLIASALHHGRHLLRREWLHHLSCTLQILMTECCVSLAERHAGCPAVLHVG